MSQALLKNNPGVIVTANARCLLHMASQSPVPIRHWVELLAENLDDQL